MKSLMLCATLVLTLVAVQTLSPTTAHTASITALDIPVIGDFDGDHIADIGVVRRSLAYGCTWAIRLSTTGATWTIPQWGALTDTPIVGDFDGDGRIDPTVYRPETGQFWILKSSCAFTCYEVRKPAVP